MVAVILNLKKEKLQVKPSLETLLADVGRGVPNTAAGRAISSLEVKASRPGSNGLRLETSELESLV